MSVLSRLKELFSRKSGDTSAEEPDFDPGRFVYLKVPGDIGPFERGEKYEDPLRNALADATLGEVTGGGSQLDDPYPDGTPRIEFCGVDIHVTDLEPALELLRERLRALGAPVGTELHYTLAGARLQDDLAEGGWIIARPRSLIHPYFRC